MRKVYAICLFAGQVLAADLTVTYLSSTSKLTRVSAVPLADGGCAMEYCGSASTADAGFTLTTCNIVDAPNAKTNAACGAMMQSIAADWKSARGL